MKRFWIWMTILGYAATASAANEVSFEIQFPETAQNNSIVKLPVEGSTSYQVTSADGKVLPSQFVAGSKLLGTANELHVIVSEVKPGTKLLVKIGRAESKDESKQMLTWKIDQEEPELLLQQNGKERKLVRFIGPKFDIKNQPEDPKKKDIGNPTTKPYHHLFDPTGTFLLTNGPEGQFPHHRAIYFGFNKTTVDGETSDTWHCRNGAHQRTGPKELHEFQAGALGASHVFPIDWIGTDGKVLVKEIRSISFYPIGEKVIVDFQSKLVPGDESKGFSLDGDPQHAGFHFRANAEVEKTAKETVFTRINGAGKPGVEQNWLPKGPVAGSINNPWNAMTFRLRDHKFSVIYLDHPNNPKEARQSERSYGRMGTYFEHTVKPGEFLHVQYRLLVAPGETTVDECTALKEGFVNRPTVKQVKN
jgi:hypothetical protein